MITQIKDCGTYYNVTNDDGTISAVPLAPGNVDYQNALAWLAAGGTLVAGDDAGPDRKTQAALELSLSDSVALRCAKSGVAYVGTDWYTRDAILRPIAKGTDTTTAIPERPATYPAGS